MTDTWSLYTCPDLQNQTSVLLVVLVHYHQLCKRCQQWVVCNFGADSISYNFISIIFALFSILIHTPYYSKFYIPLLFSILHTPYFFNSTHPLLFSIPHTLLSSTVYFRLIGAGIHNSMQYHAGLKHTLCQLNTTIHHITYIQVNLQAQDCMGLDWVCSHYFCLV